MNYFHVQFYLLKFFPALILVVSFDSLVLKTLENPAGNIGNIIILAVLIALQYLLSRISYVDIYLDRFEFIGWKRYDVQNWEDAAELRVLRFNRPNVGRIRMRDQRVIYFVSFNNTVFKGFLPFNRKKSIGSTKDIFEQIKFIHSI